MLDFLFTQANLPFTLSLAFVLLLGLFEAFSLIIGFSLLSALDDWVPIDIDAEAELKPGGSAGLVGWLCLNRLPLLIWFVLVLISFTIAGFSSNYLAFIVTGNTLPQAISLPIALIATAFSCRYIGTALANILPKSESSAVGEDSLLGSVVVVITGCAIKGNPGEAMVKDKYQQKHYVLVEPEYAGVQFSSGTLVVLLKRAGTVWSVAKFDS